MGFEQDLIDAIRRKNGLSPEGSDGGQSAAAEAKGSKSTIATPSAATINIDAIPNFSLRDLRTLLTTPSCIFKFKNHGDGDANKVLYNPQLFVVTRMYGDSYVMYNGMRVTSSRGASIREALLDGDEILGKNVVFDIKNADTMEKSYRSNCVGLIRDNITGVFLEVVYSLDNHITSCDMLRPYLYAAKGAK